jgi:hypothetical protein
VVLGTSLDLAVSIVTVIINIILVEVSIMMISMIGYHNETLQSKAIMITVFISEFFNTAILIMLVNANT